MRCLYCGNPLSVLQKVKDSDFCSAEHRSQFHGEQQRMMADRLKRAAARMKVKPAAPKPAPTVEAPAPPAAFVLKHPDVHDCAVRLMSMGPFDGIALAIAPPPLVCAAFSGNSLLPGFLPDLPWPRYNPGLWSFDVFLPEYGGEQLAALADVLAAWSPYRRTDFGLRGGLLHLRRPDVIAPHRRRLSAEAAWLWSDAGAVAGLERLCLGVGRKAHTLPLVALAGDSLPAVIVPKSGPILIAAEPLPASTTPPLPEILAHGRTHRLSAIDRIFRMRPRGAVGDPVAALISITPEPLPVQTAFRLEAGSTNRPLNGELTLEPTAVERAFRMRPRPVADSRIAGLSASGAEAKVVSLQPDTPRAQIGDCAPSALPRFLRPGNAAPVDDPRIELSEPLPAGAAAFVTGPNVPSAPAQPGVVEPPAVDRAFRMRPRSGVADSRVAGLAGAGIEAQAVSLRPETPHATVAGCAPPPLPRFFRSRARGPMDSATQASISSPPEATALVSNPAVPGAPVEAAALAPPAVDRAFRMRPRSGVADSRIADLAGSGIEAQVVQLRPEHPHAGICECAPRVLARFFRSRAAGPLNDTGLAAAESVPALSAGFTTAPEVPGAPVPIVLLVPPAVERAFRMRPRSGVTDARMADLAGSGLAAQPVAVRPETPHAGIAECAPLLVPRFFRPRPRGPAEDPALAKTAPAVSRPADFLPAPAVHATVQVEQGECAPSPVTRFFRSRLRGPLVDPTLCEAETTPAEWAAFAGTSAGSVSLPAEERACAPRTLTRLFRPRLLPVNRPASEIVEVPDALPFSCRPVERGVCGPAEGAREPLQSTKLYRMRPQGAAGTIAQPQTIAEAAGFNAARALPAFAPEPAVLEPVAVPRAFPMRPGAACDCATSSPVVEPEATPFALVASDPPLLAPECAPAAINRLYRGRPSAGVSSRVLFLQIAANAAATPPDPAYATFGHGALGVLSPDFLNRLYRMRPRTPLEDESTQAKEIRCRQVPVSEPDPVMATLPAAEKQRGLSLITRLYKFRPRGARESAPEPKRIPCEAVPGAGAEAGPPGTRQVQNDILHSISRHWKLLPLDLKAMALLIPIVFIIAFQPGAQKAGSVSAAGVRVEAPAHVQTAVETRVSGVERGIRARAAVDLREDFQSGLHRWSGKEGWGTSWKYHSSGAIMPGTLALFQPSLTLSDYKLEFSAQILDKGFGWAFRAVNDRNYYGVRLVTENAGPLPKLFLERWAVVDGVEMNRVRIPLPITVARDTIYRIALEVRDQYFTLMVQGQVVDFWSDAKLKIGGIGFFTAKGEQALVQALRITHQYDMVGRIVAALFRH
jgi:hypothetical protein